MTWSGSSTEEIPAGTGVSIQECSDIVYFAFEGEVWDGEGGIARYDTINDDWLDPFEAEWRDWGPDPDEEGLMWSSVTSLACDDENILYAGLDEGDYGIQRYDTNEDEWLESLDPWDHDFSSSGITNDAMAWADGTLAFGHEQGGNWGFAEGAFSLVAVRGDWVGGGRSVDEGITTSSVVAYPQLPGMGADWLVAQPGASGPGRAKLFDSMGGEVGILDAWTGLVDGRARHFAGNTTHVYAALLASDMDRTDGAATILEGTQAGEGDIEWERSWDLPHASIERLLLEDGILWVTTRYGGLYRIDLASGEMAGMPPTAHESLSMMTLHDGDIVVGMSAVEMAAGVSVFDRGNERWTDSALLPGLPSPQVNDIVEADGHIWFATNGGIGSWDIAGGDWGPTISAADGLGSGDARSLELIGGELWVATTGGLCAVDTSTTSTTGPQVRHCMTRSNGLVGTSSVEIASAGGLLYVSHDGFGPTRPGATQVRSVSRTALTQYHADSLPSNDVTAIAADGWGVHIATEEQPLSHWNAASNQMEHGAIAVDTGGWPITSFSSDGTTLLAATSGVMHRIAVNAIGHPVINSTRAPGIQATFQGSLGTWVAAGEDGVRPYGAAPGYEVLPQVIDRRANPLRATIGGVMTDITAEARPGNEFSIIAGAVIGEYVDALTLSEVPLILSSDVEGAAVWAKTTQLDYNGSWDLAATEAGMRALLMAVAFGTTNASGHDLHLNFASPEAGAVEVRLSYIAVTSNSPVQMLLLEDRPNDGGDALVATWTPTMEAGFTAYELSVDDGTQVNTISIPDRFNVQTVLSGLNPNTAYSVWVEVVYSNGNHSNASNSIGPVTPFDDIPLAPAWATAELNEGNVEVEWEWCTELDHYFSLWDYFTSPPEPLTSFEQGQGIDSDIVATNQTEFPAPDVPIWMMIYCVDDAWQIDLENPLIIGPISTSTEGDAEAPAPLEWVTAVDHPNDAGGALDISWAASEAPDCVLYAVHVMPVNAAWPPQSADAAPLVQWISGCETTETTITGLRDGQPYWATVVAYDANLNVDLLNSPWASATPEADLRVDEPPARVTMVTATDVADDSGHAIEVSWTPVLDADLTHYTVWVSEHDVSDVSEMWSRCSFYLDTCAEKVMMSETLVLDQALYGDELARSVRVLIRPDVELFVAVTAHGGEGGVHLSDLVTMTVTPVDDLRDEEAPPRMARPILSDVADDDGRALWMEFTPSDADDVAWYAVYVEAWAFTSACDLQPAMLLPTDAEQPIFLGRYSSGRFLEPGEDATVAIVAVDGAANANCADVLTTTMAPINNGPPPVTEPPVTGLAGEWIENGTALKLTWTRTDSARGGLSIHVSQSRFAAAGEAVLIAWDVEGDSIILRDDELDSSKPLWVAITNDHQEGAIVEVIPIEIAPFGVDTTTDPETFSDLGVVLAAVIALIALSALTVFFVMRRGRDGDSMGLDHAGLVSDDMDQTNDMWKMDEPESEPEPDPLPEFVPEEKPTVEEDAIDTSFLDDLL
jgi:hypothetical protein